MEKYFERKFRESPPDEEERESIWGDMEPYLSEISVFKVPVTGPEWLERKRESRAEGLSDENIFGEEFINLYDYINHEGPEFERDFKQHSDENLNDALEILGECPELPFIIEHKIETYKKLISSRLNNLNQQLVELIEKNPRGVRYFFYRNFYYSKDAEMLARHFGFDFNPGDEQNKEKAKEFADHCFAKIKRENGLQWDYEKKSSISIKMLKNHINNIHIHEFFLRTNLSELRTNFITQLLKIIDEKKLPIKKKDLIERIKNLRVEIVDDLLASLGEFWGDYNAETNTARISSIVDQKNIPAVFVHESFHALSGQMDIMEETDVGNVFSQNMRVGLHFSDLAEIASLAKPTRPVLKWLNEGVTERLTMEILNGKTGTYKNERELLELLISNGLEKSTIEAAYFENYYGNKRKKHPLPNIKKLFEVANEKFGNRFLVDLDLCIRVGFKNGVSEAVKLWKEKGVEFPSLVASEANIIREKLRNKQKDTPSNS